VFEYFHGCIRIVHGLIPDSTRTATDDHGYRRSKERSCLYVDIRVRPLINRVRTGRDCKLRDHAGMDRGLSGDVRVDTVFIRIETVIVRVTTVKRPC
jgi:hypothetical protein